MVRRGLLVAVLLLSVFGGFAQAQTDDETALRFYIVPKIGTGSGPGAPGSGIPADPYRPKYFSDNGWAFSAIDYGVDFFLVGAVTTPEQHAFLVAQGDVWAIPDINTTVGGNPTLNRIRNDLEARSMPGTWIESPTTYRFLVRRLGSCALILQRIRGAVGRHVFGSGNTLPTTLTGELLNDFMAAGESLGLDTSGLNTGLTIRAAILYLADQLPPFHLAGETF
jgi:hypothetical protein